MRFLIPPLLLLSLVGSPPAWADDASKTQKIEEYFKLTNVESNIRNLVAQMSQRVQSVLAQQLGEQQNQNPGAQELVRNATAQQLAIVEGALGWDQIRPALVKLYGDTFTEPELDDILAFYRSNTGQSMVRKMATLLPESNQLAQERIMAVQPQIQQLQRETVEKLRALNPNAPPQ